MQTPLATLPYSYSIFDNKVFKIDVLCEGHAMHGMITSFSHHVISKINRFDTSLLHHATIKPLVGAKLLASPTVRSKLSLTAKNVDDIGVFDVCQQDIGLESIHTFDRVICLFEVRRLVVSDKVAFWQTNLLQVKQCSPVCAVRKCLIVDGPWDITKFEIYDKMHRLGVHSDAIRHKMKLGGFGDDFFHCWHTRMKTTGTSSTMMVQDGETHTTRTSVIPPMPAPAPPPPPPPPPLPGMLSRPPNGVVIKQASGPLAFLKDISSGNFVLRKASGGKGQAKPKGDLQGNGDFTPPSLEEIQGALSKLKKVERTN